MQIHELKVEAKKSSKRVGRGGRRGTYSGRGMNGQKARSGGNVDPLFEGGRSSLVQRMKKLRGFKSVKPSKNIFTLVQLENKFEDGDVVSVITLLEKKMLRKKVAKNGVKIVATKGEITKKLKIDNEILVTATAKIKIEKAGGTLEMVKSEN